MMFSTQDRFSAGDDAFDHAHVRAHLQVLMGKLRRVRTSLWNFNEIQARLHLIEQHPRGFRDVALDSIVGSVGRTHDFTVSFRPKADYLKERWKRIYALALGTEGFPAVELYQVCDAFFVVDGHHRISVARQLGIGTIQANVTEWETPVCLQTGMSIESLASSTPGEISQ